jgi:hypothetical protein
MIKFELGRVLATPAAIEAIEQARDDATVYIERHMRGDWGDLCAEDRAGNQQALKSGARLMSVYKLSDGETIWIITEAVGEDGKRAVTTLLLPMDY